MSKMRELFKSLFKNTIFRTFFVLSRLQRVSLIKSVKRASYCVWNKVQILFQIVLQNIYFHVLIHAAVFALAKMLGQFRSFGIDSDI